MSIPWGDREFQRYSYMLELVWFTPLGQHEGVSLYSTTNNSTRSGMTGDWEHYFLPNAMPSGILTADGYNFGYLRNLHVGSDKYDTIHQFIAATFPGVKAYHAWVGYSKMYPTLDYVHHAVDWYVQQPAEYLSSWYQHYVFTDITQPDLYWKSNVSMRIGTIRIEDSDDEPEVVLESSATVFVQVEPTDEP